ncbi:MAG TPA: type VI secretion system tip protein TssI/VgrG, partial [Urbifossiella sp.]|nr:type VI secretion system tip protein TssI/VgrG [Urbifossiella sp.]
AKYSQAGRLMAVDTPLGADALLLETLTGSEALSDLFQFELGLLAESGTAVAFDQLLGQPVTVRLEMPAGGVRFINGIVSRFAQGSELRGTRGDETFVRYRAVIVPKLWLLGRQANSRLFQQMAVPDILKAVLGSVTPDFRLQGTYEPRDYCTQYRETDLAFATRLMEEEGIYYFFTHAAGKHSMVIADLPGAHIDLPGPALIYDMVEGGLRPEDRVTGWEKAQELRAGKVALRDYSFELPEQNLEATDSVQADVPVGKAKHALAVGGNNAFELYDYPGLYAQRFDGVDPGGGDRAGDLQKIFQDNTRTAKIRMQQETARTIQVDGTSTCPQLTAGHTFTLTRHADADGKYVLTRVAHAATLEGEYTGRVNPAAGYQNGFECVPFGLPYRPAVRAPRPVIAGTQSAVVVGNPGDDITTDKYGRVKVQFPWDRDGKKDQNSSCWVRVATSWAGQQWGAISLPRVGQEVVVAFEEGDPDRPIVVGSVYNAAMMPPYTLPDNKTRSTVKSRSTTGGAAANFNEIRFEDKTGEEEVYVHAEKDFNRVVENNDTLKVGFEKKDKGDQTVEVFNNQTVTVGAGKGQNPDGSQTLSVYKDRTATVETGNETLTVKAGDRLVTVNVGNDTHQVKTGNRAVTIDMGNDTLTIKLGNQTTKLNLGASTTEAMQKIELKVGASSILVDQSGVTIKGLMVKVEGEIQTSVKGTLTEVSGDGILQLKGGVTMIG